MVEHEQFMACQFDQPRSTPELRLAARVLQQGIQDYQRHKNAPPNKPAAYQLKLESEAWIRGAGSPGYVFSFDRLCQLLGYDPDEARTAVLMDQTAMNLGRQGAALPAEDRTKLILGILQKYPRPLTTTEIASETHLAWTTVKNYVYELVRAGQVLLVAPGQKSACRQQRWVINHEEIVDHGAVTRR